MALLGITQKRRPNILRFPDDHTIAVLERLFGAGPLLKIAPELDFDDGGPGKSLFSSFLGNPPAEIVDNSGSGKPWHREIGH